jgi:hypothetical protein
MKQTGQIGFFVPTSGLTMQKTTLDTVFPIPDELKICTDAFLTRTAFTQGHVHSIPDSLGLYRKHQNHVLDNENFDNFTFNEKLLYPLLNDYYKKQNISFQFGSSKYYSLPERLSPLETFKKFVEVYILEKWENLSGQKIVIFGAGEHTAWLEKITFGHKGPTILAVLDQNPDTVKQFWTQQVQNASDWAYQQEEIILLSSDTVAEGMAKQCKSLYGKDCQTIDLYQSLPPGPFPKKTPYYTF